MTDDNFTYNDFIKFVDVSRETYLQLEGYVALLKKWQQKINLISNSTISDVWFRHVVDSAQLMKYLTPADNVMDVGSGAGFPGIVLAVLGIKNITLVESDMRKATFLREAARVAGVNVSILSQRVESVSLSGFTVITARGFASIDDTLTMLNLSADCHGKLLFLKGKNYDAEIRLAQNNWKFTYDAFPSVTSGDSAIVLIKNMLKQGVKSHEQPA